MNNCKNIDSHKQRAEACLEGNKDMALGYLSGTIHTAIRRLRFAKDGAKDGSVKVNIQQVIDQLLADCKHVAREMDSDAMMPPDDQAAPDADAIARELTARYGA